MSDKQIHDKFLHLFQGFIKDLTVALPDYSEQLTNDYSSLLEKTSIAASKIRFRVDLLLISLSADIITPNYTRNHRD